jgi:zinc-binding alcohol dehydrogenase/oxidoreductase
VRAIILRDFSGPSGLAWDTWDDPVPGPGEVVVQIRAAALNRRDLYATFGQYPGLTVPAIPGSDGAGVISAVGPEVAGWTPGDAVVINPALDWGDNPRVAGPGFNILGIPRNGTWAELVAVPAHNVYPKPPHLTWEEAAAVPLAGLTAYRALFTRGQLVDGETVLIPGVGGGVATFLVQFAARAGARVAVTSSRDEKLERARLLGADITVRYDNENWVRELRGRLGAGADLAVDGVGGTVFKDLVALTRPGGRIVSYGATKGPVPELVMPRVFLKHLDVRGTSMGSPVDFGNMLAWLTTHHLHPVVDRVLPLQAAAEGLAAMADGHQFGKIVLTVDV